MSPACACVDRREGGRKGGRADPKGALQQREKRTSHAISDKQKTSRWMDTQRKNAEPLSLLPVPCFIHLIPLFPLPFLSPGYIVLKVQSSQKRCRNLQQVSAYLSLSPCERLRLSLTAVKWKKGGGGIPVGTIISTGFPLMLPATHRFFTLLGQTPVFALHRKRGTRIHMCFLPCKQKKTSSV
mmetsp:Transcript_12567/g.24442  ORF Transcript_12567/g.24442 Transcript_12567/m.24442 type:complete len:183 (-) Transcript_12567:1557-2105(-)